MKKLCNRIEKIKFPEQGGFQEEQYVKAESSPRVVSAARSVLREKEVDEEEEDTEEDESSDGEDLSTSEDEYYELVKLLIQKASEPLEAQFLIPEEDDDDVVKERKLKAQKLLEELQASGVRLYILFSLLIEITARIFPDCYSVHFLLRVSSCLSLLFIEFHYFLRNNIFKGIALIEIKLL